MLRYTITFHDPARNEFGPPARSPFNSMHAQHNAADQHWKPVLMNVVFTEKGQQAMVLWSKDEQ